MDPTLLETTTPEFAVAMCAEVTAGLGPVVASSSSTHEGEIVAWAVAVEHAEYAVVCAVARRDPGLRVAVRVPRAHALSGMMMARSLVHRSGKRIAEGDLAPAHFGDLPDVPLDLCAPQFAIAPAASYGLALAGVTMAVGCTWAEMALAPEQRAAAVHARARAEGGVTGAVLTPVERALDGLCRSLRKAKEPLLSDAAWALQSLVAAHPEPVRERLQELVLADGLSEERLEVLGALVDGLNQALIAAVSGEPPDRPRVVLCRLRLPRLGKDARAREVVAYYYPAAHRSRSTLEVRHPERPLAGPVERAGFALLDEVLDKHMVVIRSALLSPGALSLQRGFHADVSLADARVAFAADGFLPLALALDP